MSEASPQSADQLTRLIVSIFEVNGALISAGDELVADLPLTSSRWQVMGAVAEAPAPLTMASVARNMGLTRQGVRAAVKVLVAAELVHVVPNPHHQRAPLVLLTAQGSRVYAEASARQRVWAQSLASGIPGDRVADAADLLHTLLLRLAEHRRPAVHR